METKTFWFLLLDCSQSLTWADISLYQHAFLSVYTMVYAYIRINIYLSCQRKKKRKIMKIDKVISGLELLLVLRTKGCSSFFKKNNLRSAWIIKSFISSYPWEKWMYAWTKKRCINEKGDKIFYFAYSLKEGVRDRVLIH